MGWILWFIGIFGLYSWNLARKSSIQTGSWEKEKGVSIIWLIIWIGFLVSGAIMI